jgi:acetylornithine/succinyldiaminopimelate/putrescine aminotransferase
LFWVIPVILATGAVLGAINGLGITAMGLPPVIMTLAMNSIVYGIILIYTRGGSMFGAVPPALINFIVGKALSGGYYPVSAVLSTRDVLGLFKPGDHGSTFGGNPLAAAAGCAVFQIIRDEGLLENAQKMGAYLRQRILELKQETPMITEVRGAGLMVGVELAQNGTELVSQCLAKGLYVNFVQSFNENHRMRHSGIYEIHS